MILLDLLRAAVKTNMGRPKLRKSGSGRGNDLRERIRERQPDEKLRSIHVTTVGLVLAVRNHPPDLPTWAGLFTCVADAPDDGIRLFNAPFFQKLTLKTFRLIRSK